MECYCSKCGGELKFHIGEVSKNWEASNLIIDPCSYCLKQETQKAVRKGKRLQKQEKRISWSK